MHVGLEKFKSTFYFRCQLLSSITQVLSQNGLLLASEIVEKGDITGATPRLISDYLFQHKTEFEYLLSQQWRFAWQPVPGICSFESIISAIIYAFNVLGRSATAEELQ